MKYPNSQYVKTRPLLFNVVKTLNIRLPVQDLDYTDYGLTITSLQFGELIQQRRDITFIAITTVNTNRKVGQTSWTCKIMNRVFSEAALMTVLSH